MTFILYLVVSLFIASCVILTLLVLIQKGRGGGLSSAFGGGAGGHTAFGSKTGDVLTWATSVVFGVFLILAVLANLAFNAASKSYAAQRGLATSSIPSESQTPVGSTGPGKTNSSLPQAPITADPGVANAPTGPAQPPVPTATPTTGPTEISGPTTNPSK